jgi:uncharacterized DUF497 family protein
MEFEWDEAKSERNRIARGLPFRLAIAIFEGHVVGWEDARRDYGEVRVSAIGQSEGQILACVYTDRDGKRRIISLRRASRKERHDYRKSELGRH